MKSKFQKNVVMLAVLLYANSSIKCQTFTISQFQSFATQSAETFENTMLSLNYAPDPLFTNLTYTIYKSRNSKADGSTDMFNRYQEPTALSPIILFTSTSFEFYRNIKNSLSTNGYTYEKTDTVSVSGTRLVWKYYKNASYTLVLYTSNFTNVTAYNYQIFKTKRFTEE